MAQITVYSENLFDMVITMTRDSNPEKIGSWWKPAVKLRRIWAVEVYLSSLITAAKIGSAQFLYLIDQYVNPEKN